MNFCKTNVDVPAIFLSHSGWQKPFVEHLYDALRSANHTAFFDQHDLPKGSPFPGNIKQAARGCRLGVVVLSDEFLMSKWPMLELQMLVQQRGNDARVLPLFYKLRPADLKSPTNLSKWRSAWEEKAIEHAAQWGKWEKPIELLDSFNGEVFVPGTSETAYIKKVVQRISTIVPCHVHYDLSSIQGHQRMTEVIARKFEDVKARRYEELACIRVGLHGVGGLGKTTLCKSMVNFYTSQYPGRSYLIEFPSDGDKEKIAQESKRALKTLTSLSNELLSKTADDFDQVVALMKEHVKGHDVFLAIDNVLESSKKEAERLLGVGFSAGSKVLLTSRSEEVLRDLLREHGSIGPLPAPEHEKAYQIFQKSFKLGDLRILVDRRQIDKVLERCRFNGVYHALALEALAQHVQSVCKHRDLKNIEYDLSLILKEVSNADLGTVEKVIRLNYDRLPQAKKDMFLDIVILPMTHGIFRLNAAGDNRWLCALYKEFPATRITALIDGLALDGLIQLGSGKDGTANEGEIEAHDLYVDLARREAANSPRFFCKGPQSSRIFRTGSTKPMEELEWVRLRSVILSGDEASRFFEEVRHQECRALLVLVAAGIHSRTMVHLDCMPSLCWLKLEWDSSGLYAIPASRVVRLKGLDQLQILRVSHSPLVQRIEGLGALWKLRELQLIMMRGLEKLDDLSGLSQLEALDVSHCTSLKKMPDLSGLARLNVLRLTWNTAMEEVEGLSSSLKEIALMNLNGLTKRLDMRGLTRLERLTLKLNSVAMEELISGEYFSSNLKHLEFLYYRTPQQVSLQHFTLLQSLKFQGYPFMQKLEVGSHNSTLKSLDVWLCEALEEIGDFSALHCMERLKIMWCPRLTKLVSLQHLTLLQSLSIVRCSSIKKLEVGCHSTLKSLEVSVCEVLEEIGDLSPLHCLKELIIQSCPRLTKLVSLQHLTLLQSLCIVHCSSIKKLEVGCHSTLKSLRVSECEALEEIGDLSALHCLEELSIEIDNCPRLTIVQE